MKRKARYGETYPHQQSQAKMPLNIPSQILWKISDQIVFINTSGFLPFVLLMSSDSFSQAVRE